MKYLIIILILISFGCRSSKMIRTNKGMIHRYQREYIGERFEFDDARYSIDHVNDRGEWTYNLNWSDIKIAGSVDSVRTKYLEYNK